MMLGTYKREYPRGWVVRGYDPMNPTTQSISLPVNKSLTGEPDPIYAGMLISVRPDGTAWQLGVGTASDTEVNTISFTQDEITRWDVAAADQLVGFPCSGQFRFATPYFARFTKGTSTGSGTGTAATYKAGTPLTFCADTETEYALTEVNTKTGELVAPAKPRSLRGFIRPAETGEVVIGRVAETHSGVNRSAMYTESKYTVPAKAMQATIGTATDSTSKFTNAYVVIWDSTFAAIKK